MTLLRLETRRRHRRRGVALFPVVVCLVIATLLCGALVQTTRVRRLRGRDEAHRLQADWLAASALARARSRLAADPNYAGETWQLSPSDLAGPDPGRATIRVEMIANQSAGRRVVVVATYPAADVGRAQKTLSATLRTGTTPKPADAATKAKKEAK